ncbi:PBSX family phage terminase large subunit [Pedobacter agri]|uniref:Phage terminase large subunit n=1 Tax=Pedobacter agri TaxID=454586 RepID=A0A9X3DCI8_9SPHI|nr:phage terminase large subunit [Pedobacter agri]MCX3264802.1 phage terminase large subunit [Pedobacter agri]
MLATPSFSVNVKFKPLFSSDTRYKHLWGGRARGGSHAATDYFLFLITKKEYFRGLFVREIFGDIAGSLFQDFKDRLNVQVEAGNLNEDDFTINESKKTILYKPTGNTIISKGFKSASSKSSAKLKSIAGITHVLIEEAEEVDESDFNKLDDSIRTNKIENIEIIMLFNPPGKNHWIMKRWYNLMPAVSSVGTEIEGWYRASPKTNPDLLSIHTTFLDNLKNLNSKTISKYHQYGDPESPMYNEDFYYRDVLGLVSEGAKGRIYKKVKPCTAAEYDALPYEPFYGLDFGFYPDPVAFAEHKRHNNTLWSKQLIYEQELTNQQLAERIKLVIRHPNSPIYADSAESKSIQELIDERLNVYGAVKGPDSVDFGIKKLQGLTWYITEDSTDFWFENQEYKYQLGADKLPTGKPIDKHNHLKDEARYAVITHEIYGGGERSTGRRN